MQTRIIVPLDGSRPAEHALPHALALARATGSELTLLHVVSIPQAANPLVWGVRAVSTASAIRDELVESAHEYLRDITSRLGSEASEGMTVQVEVLEGEAAEAIVVYAEQHPEVVMTVMTTRGRSGLTRWVLGSVAEKVLQASPVPLVLIRPQVGSENQAEVDASAFGRWGLPAIPTYRTILVPLDFSLLAEEALPHARALATATGAALLLVSVMPLPYPIDLPGPDQVTRDDANNAEAGSLLPPRQSVAKALKEVYEREKVALTQYLASVARRVEEAGTPRIEVRMRDLEGDAAKEILRASSEGGADLIVMSTQGRGGLARLWPGSVAMSVVREAALPVLLVPAHLAR
ncbi:MAG TPA: universal stress protein [Chloroflexia bacterium]|nr:universal stress protein [Chloroflexia bacterium]